MSMFCYGLHFHQWEYVGYVDDDPANLQIQTCKVCGQTRRIRQESPSF